MPDLYVGLKVKKWTRGEIHGLCSKCSMINRFHAKWVLKEGAILIKVDLYGNGIFYGVGFAGKITTHSTTIAANF